MFLFPPRVSRTRTFLPCDHLQGALCSHLLFPGLLPSSGRTYHTFLLSPLAFSTQFFGFLVAQFFSPPPTRKNFSPCAGLPPSRPSFPFDLARTGIDYVGECGYNLSHLGILSAYYPMSRIPPLLSPFRKSCGVSTLKFAPGNSFPPPLLASEQSGGAGRNSRPLPSICSLRSH